VTPLSTVWRESSRHEEREFGRRSWPSSVPGTGAGMALPDTTVRQPHQARQGRIFGRRRQADDGRCGRLANMKKSPFGEARAGNPTRFIGGCRIISVERFGRRAFPRHTTTARRPFLVTFTRRRRTSVGPPLTPSGITTREPEANASWGTDRASETGTETTSVVAASGPNLGLRARGGYKPWGGTSTRL
jgi:hypothetical protein